MHLQGAFPSFSQSHQRFASTLQRIAMLALTCEVLAVGVGCGATNFGQNTVPVAQLQIAVSPSTVSLSPTAKQRFTATVRGNSNTAVLWSASAGSISPDGTFSAPAVNSGTQIIITATSVTEATQHATSLVTIQHPSQLAITTSSLNGAVVGTLYDANLSASGGTPPYRWAISAGSLPNGLQLRIQSGAIAGTAGMKGQYPFVAEVTDAASNSAKRALTLTVLRESNCGAPNYCSSTSTANPGTIAPLFTGTAGVNQTAFDTSYNPAGLDCYTRATDSTTFGGESVGNNTYSGGNNDVMWSKNSNFVGTTERGYVHILVLDVSGNCAKILNTGNITGTGGIGVSGPFAFSKVVDNVFYNVSGYTKIYKNTITVPYNKTYTSTLLYDVSNCPALSGLSGWSWNGILGTSNDDTRFAMSLSNRGGQGTGTWSVVYDTTLGCAVENTITGAYWEFGATSQTGTLASSKTCTNAKDCSCWGGTIHNSQFSGDGTQVVISEASPAWTKGACAGASVGTLFSVWQAGTQYTQYCSSNISGLGGLYCGGHDSVGTSRIINSESASVASTRDLSNVLTYTQHGTGPLWSAHGYWPQPDKADDYPYVQTTYGVLSSGQDTGCGSPNHCPIVGGNAIFADYPYNPGAQRTYFGHTYSCNQSTDSAYATCQGGGDYEFGCQYSIMSVSQNGNWAMVASGMLLSLGLDSKGHPRCDTFIVHLQ